MTARLPILNLGDYDLWLMRIEQYFLMTNYSLWEVIKNGNKVLRRTVGTVEQEYEPTTAEEKHDRRNEMKARATLLMALPNKDQLKFHSYQDAKLLMEAIEKRYGGNKESKKVQRTFIKQQYKNFAALSSETMDQTFDRLQKLTSQLDIQREVINQEDMNLKLLRSLPSEWKTHVLIWRNKVEIETISLDDLYNNLKIYEPEITDDTAHGVSTTHTQGNGVNSICLDNLYDVVIYAFLASQPNSPQLSQEDLEQLHPDDLEEMDLQCEMAMMTIRARRFIKRTGKKLDINGQRVGFDKSKVECFNCHKHGHFARECRFPRNQECKGRKNNTRTIAVENPTQNVLIAQDGIGGYDWSYQAEEEQPTNHALMAFTSSGSSSSSDSEVDSCSKTCVKAYATLKEQYDSLSSDYKKSQFNLVSYKAGLESVEARLAHYKKNEAVFEESINVLKLEVRLRDNALNEYKMNLEKAEKERDQLKQTLEKFQNSSKSLNNILESQVIDKFKTGLGYDAATAASPAVESFVNLTDKSGSDKGYHSVPPPLTGNFIPRKPDLTFVDEIVESENLDVTTVVTPSNAKTVENKGVSNTVESNAVRMNNTSAPIIEDWNSDDESEIDYTVRPNTEKIESVKTVRETDAPKQNKQYPRGNQRNWNNLMSQRLGSDFKMTNKACYVCGSFEHLHYVCDKKVERPVWNNSRRGNQQQKEYKEKGVIESGYSRHMTGIKCYLDEYKDYDGGFVSFGDGKERIFGKGKIKTGSLDFDDVYFCKKLKYNLFSVSQICDKKNNVLFTDTECLVLSFNFKLLDKSQVLLRVLRKDNIYSVDLKSVVPTGGLTCLITKATIDESNTWHRRLGHINFKTMNKLVKGNLVKGLLSKIFENGHSCVAFTDDFSRFSWVFFLATKDETSGILKTFITEIENQLDHKVKVIRSDNGTEFKNNIMNQFCEINRIKREFSVARTPQQNGIAERKNRTLIEAAGTMVLVIKPHNKTPYELIRGRPPLIDFMKPFGCPVTILNTKDHLGKFDGKADEGYFVGYSIVSKAMRVFNKRIRIVKETLNIRFLKNTPNMKGNGPDWLFDVDSLSISMNYVPVAAGNKTNGIAGTKDNIVAGQAQKEKEHEQEYILIPLCTTDPIISQGPKDYEGDAGIKPTKVDKNEALDKSGKHDQEARSESERLNQREMQTEHTNSSNGINTVSIPVSTVGPSFDTAVRSTPVNTVGPSVSTANESEEQPFERFSPFKNAFTLPPVPNISSMDNTGIFGNAYDDEGVEEEVDMNNVISSYTVPDTSFTKFHKDHPEDQVIGSLKTLAIGTKWVFRNKKDERGIVVKNKTRLVAQGHTQEEGIDYDEVFAPVARIEAIRLFLAYASFKDFVVYQMDVKSAFSYGKIEEEVYVCQPPSFEDPHFPDKVYKVYVDDIIFGSTKKQMSNEFETLMHDKFQMSSIGELSFFLGLQVKQKSDRIFINQDKYVAEILKKFDFASVKTASTLIETNKALVKDEEAEDVDVHLYRLMIGSLMYLTSSRPDIMFTVCACARFQVTPKTSHFNAVKRIFRYLKGQHKLGRWYPRDSPFDLEAFSDSDYAGASLDRKSTTGSCQFLGVMDPKSDA
ncbi:putative ribonuclease H-like domain-containing protein [Tanacetum coccineum]